MNTITSSALQSLLDDQDGVALTIYLPTHRHPTPPNMREDQIRFKNALKTAEELLQQAGAGQSEIMAILGHLSEKQEDIDFWRRTSEGTVFFVNKDKLVVYCLPFECDERIHAGYSFDVGLAYAACSFDQSYLLLALAVHDPKIYKGTISGLEPIGIELPKSPEAALNIDEMFVNSNTVRGVSTSGGGNDKLSSHGQGDSREAGNEERLMFFRLIDSAITNQKGFDPHVPLLIAGIDSEVAEYKDISKHPRILNGHVAGNHTNTQHSELQTLAWDVIDKEINAQMRHDVIDRYNEVQGFGKSSADVQDIHRAADAGRVDTLIIAALTATRDTVSDKASAIMKLVSPERYTRMNVDELIRKVVAQGGKVIGLDAAQLPKGAELAAIYRY